MPNSATQLDIEHVREDMGIFRKSVDDRLVDIRDRQTRHSDEDDRRFNEVKDDIETLITTLAKWTGALTISKWVLGICLPVIAGLLFTDMVRHWKI